MSSQQAVVQGKLNFMTQLGRLAVTLVIALFLARIAAHWMQGDVKRPSPAGLGRGILHGAIMPLAMPGLLIGNDADIYSASNTGRSYKLGYTLGVDLCGAAFFGWSFFRLSHWKK